MSRSEAIRSQDDTHGIDLALGDPARRIGRVVGDRTTATFTRVHAVRSASSRPSTAVAGDIGAGDRVDVVSRPAHGVTSALVSRALLGEPELLGAALEAPELPAELRAWMRERAGR